MGNAVLALGTGSFRAFVHPPEAMLDVVRRHGLQPVYRRRGRVVHRWGRAAVLS
ncbi:hypothetical protein [Sinomonas flava]|uniref:hypothetical protein n=1 Tax=Sinomonas flava TaxID=496857 RepID=UPI0039A3FEC2